MKKDPTLHSMQIDVPHSVYGKCTYFIPSELNSWLLARNLRYSLCHQSSSGDGFTNGVTNIKSHYMVNNIEEVDGLAFKIMFLACGVHICKQYSYA